MQQTYIIEHMEPMEGTSAALPPWVTLEYSHIISQTCSDSSALFSHLTPETQATLPNELKSNSETKGIEDLVKQGKYKSERICLLDPKAETAICPADKELFDVFLFGGILGDDPPRDRTAELRNLGYPSRHLGPTQMTTDTAVGVTHRVISQQVELDSIPYVKHPTIRFNDKESVEMPFKYMSDEKGEPIMPEGMRELLREDMNKSFEF